MQVFWPYISFILGAIFALVMQWVSYRLAFRKDQRREYWIRKLNSYQDFNQYITQLIGLLRSELSIPDNVYWQSILAARKAAYDAAFYDKSHPERTDKMKAITVDVLKILQSDNRGREKLEILEKQIKEIQANFYLEEKLLSKEGR